METVQPKRKMEKRKQKTVTTKMVTPKMVTPKMVKKMGIKMGTATVMPTVTLKMEQQKGK